MKITIVGAGKVGVMLASQLSSEGHDLTLIDINQIVLDSVIESLDVMTINGNGATMSILRQSNIEDTDLLIAVASADEVNLLCCMTAHAINPKIHTIARIRTPEYTEQIYGMRNSFALSLTFNPERKAAKHIERQINLPGFLKQDSFAKDRVEIVELKVDADSKLNGIALHELGTITRCRILVCVVLRNGNAIMPSGDFVLRAEDRIFVTAQTNVLSMLLKNLGIITRKVNRVLLAGGGRVSYYLAQNLIKSGYNVRIIDKDYKRCQELSVLLPEADIVYGDASDQAFLLEEGMAECDTVVSLTGIDEMNLVISLYATDAKVSQVITKLGHVNNNGVLDRLPIGSVVCPKELSCNTVVRYVRAMQKQSGAAISVHSIALGQAEAIEFSVDEYCLHRDEPLKNIKIRKNVLIVCISHSGTTEIPNGDSSFHQGDTVVVVTKANTVLMQLNDIFE